MVKDREETEPTCELTGNYYFKTSLFGLILLVEKKTAFADGYSYTRFYKSKITDLFELQLIKSRKPD